MSNKTPLWFLIIFGNLFTVIANANDLKNMEDSIACNYTQLLENKNIGTLNLYDQNIRYSDMNLSH